MTIIEKIIFLLLVYLVHTAVNAQFPGEMTYGTETAYRNCPLDHFPRPRGEMNPTLCKAVHVSSLYRHGSMSASDNDVQKFRQVKEKLVNSRKKGGTLILHDFEKVPIPFDRQTEQRQLLESGKKELFEHAKEIREIASINEFPVTKENTVFYSSDAPRAYQSGEAFYKELLRVPSVDNATRPITINNELIRFYDYCDGYIKKVKENNDVLKEQKKFIASHTMQKALKEFVESLQVDGSEYGVDDLVTIYRACSFSIIEKTDNMAVFPWCELLQRPISDVVEYSDDLKQYWQKSYPFEVSYRQACPLLASMLTQLNEAATESIKSSGNIKRGSFFFGHSEAIIPMATLLGLFNQSIGHSTPQHLTADLYQQHLAQVKARPTPPTTWSGARISPMAAYVKLILYDCTSQVPPSQDIDPMSKFYVRLLVNDKDVAWPLAGSTQPPTTEKPGGNVAPLKTVMEAYRSCMPGVFNQKETCRISKANILLKTVTSLCILQFCVSSIMYMVS